MNFRHLLSSLASLLVMATAGCRVAHVPVTATGGPEVEQEPQFVLTFYSTEAIRSITPPPIGPQPSRPAEGWPNTDFVLTEYDLVEFNWDTMVFTFVIDDPEIIVAANGVWLADHFSLDYAHRRLFEGEIYRLSARSSWSPTILIGPDRGLESNDFVVRLIDSESLYSETHKPPVMASSTADLGEEIRQYLASVVWQRSP